MTTGLVLIAAILILGGVIATVGDRLGMKVGKARLSLFNLRPRQTATVITVLTGVIISASTFGILFAIDDRLRTGVFELEEIQDELADVQQELQQAKNERQETRQELRQALTEQQSAQQRLRRINRSLQDAIAQRDRTQARLAQTRSQLGQIQTSYRQAQAVLRTVSQQADSLRAEIQQLETDRRQQIVQRDREIADRNAQIAQRDRAIRERETQLEELESQREFLVAEVRQLEREFQTLRQGNVALLRNQVLANGTLRIVDPSGSPQAIDQLLREANQTALQAILPGIELPDRQIIRITTTQVTQLIEQLQDGQDFVIRIFSAGNYVVGEPCVLANESCIQVYGSAIPNERVFYDREIIASTPVDASQMSAEQLIERINFVVAGAKFRARQLGILEEYIQVSDGRQQTIVNFFEALRRFDQPAEIQVITIGDTYTGDRLRLELVGLQNGQPLFSTEVSANAQ